MVASDQNQLDRGESSPTHSHFIQIDALKTWSSIRKPHSHVLMLITGGADATARGTQSTQRQPNTEREARGRRSMPDSESPGTLKAWSSIRQPHSLVLMLITDQADATARGTQSTQRQPNTEPEARRRRSMPESESPADADADAGVVVEKRNLPGDQ